MPRSWEEIIKERQNKTNAKGNNDPYLGDDTAKSRNIPLAKEPWQQVLVKRGADPYGYLDDKGKKEYNRPYYDPTLSKEKNEFLQGAYDRSVNPIDRIATNDHMRDLVLSKAQTTKKARPMENATISNIPKVTKEVPKSVSPIDLLNQSNQMYANYKEAPRATAERLKNTSALDMLSEREKLLQSKIGANTTTPNKQQPGINTGVSNTTQYRQSDFLPTSPDVKFKNEVKKKGLSFVAGLTSPITKLGMTLDTYFSKDPKTGLYPEDGSKWRTVSNWYTTNEDKLLAQGMTKKQIKEARKQELAMAKQEDDYNLLNAAMDKPRRYQQTTGDQIANMTGSVVGSVAQAILTGNTVGAIAPGMNPIAQAAATGGITEGISSFSDRDSLESAAKDIARNALFFGAGKYGSDKVGQVADQLMWKYGVQNNVALEYAKEALKGIGFDAAGYAATLPTYPLTGDQAPSKKDIAMDMAIGALFDAIPNLTSTHAMVKDNKARMEYSMNSIKQTYENIAKYKQVRPYDTEGISQMYDVLMDNITATRDVINNTKIVGQDPNIAKLNSLFDQTEAAIQMTKNMQNTRLEGEYGEATGYARENMGALTNNEAVSQRPYTQDPIVPTNPLYPKSQGQFKVNPTETMHQVLNAYRADQEARAYWGDNVPEWDGGANPYENNPRVNHSLLGNSYELEPQKAATPTATQQNKAPQATAPSYGRNGKKAYTKWANNEAVMAKLEDPNNPYTQMYNTVFNKWYEAGRLGLEQHKVPYAEIDAEFPPYITDAIFQAGRNDMGKDTEIQTDPDTQFANKVNEYVQKRLQEQKTAQSSSTPQDKKATQPLSTLKEEKPGTRVYFKDPNKYYQPTTGTIEGVTQDGQVQIRVDKATRKGIEPGLGKENIVTIAKDQVYQIDQEVARDGTHTPLLPGEGVRLLVDQNHEPIDLNTNPDKANKAKNAVGTVENIEGGIAQVKVKDKIVEVPTQFLERNERDTMYPKTAIQKGVLDIQDKVETPNVDQGNSTSLKNKEGFKVGDRILVKPKDSRFDTTDFKYGEVTNVKVNNGEIEVTYKDEQGNTETAFPQHQSVILRNTNTSNLGPKGSKAQLDHKDKFAAYYDGIMAKPYESTNYPTLDPEASQKLHEAGVLDFEQLEQPFQGIIHRTLAKKDQLKFFEKLKMAPTSDAYKNAIEQYQQEKQGYDKLDPTQFTFKVQEAKPKAQAKPEEDPTYVPSEQKATKEQTQSTLDRAFTSIRLESYNHKLFQSYAKAGDFSGAINELKGMIYKHKKHLLNNRFYSPKPIQRQIEQYFEDHSKEIENEILRMYGLTEPTHEYGERLAPGEQGKIKTVEDFAKKLEDELLTEISKKRKVTRALSKGNMQQVRYEINELLAATFRDRANSLVYSDVAEGLPINGWIKENKERLIGKVFELLGAKDPGKVDPDQTPEGYQQVQNGEPIQVGEKLLRYDKNFNLEEVEVTSIGEVMGSTEIGAKAADGNSSFLYPKVEKLYRKAQATQANNDEDWLANMGFDEPQAQTNPGKEVTTTDYEAQTKELLGTQQKEVYNYLNNLKNGKKSAVYYKSPELQGVDGLQKLASFIRFTDNPGDHKLDVLQMEMAHTIPGIEEMGLEEFGQYLVDAVTYNREANKEIKAIKAEGVNENEPINEIRNNGEGTLETVQTENVQGTPTKGDLIQEPLRSAGENERGNGGSTRPGNELRPGVGDNQGEVHTSTRGELEASTEKVKAEVKAKKEKTLETSKGKNFVIKQDLDLSKNEQGRYEDNIAAIKLIKQLEMEKRFATPKEQEILAKYVGWGGLSKYFAGTNELNTLLTKEEYAAAKASTLTSFYTPINVIQSVYEGLGQLGFKGGRILEPSAGVGSFIGAAPSKFKNMSWSAVELDKITGAIAKYLYPNAHVEINGYEKTLLPDNFYDLAIGNVPFGDFGVNDATYPKTVQARIHNYFFAKSLDKVRPGGIVAFITSTGTLDSKNTAVRTFLSKQADLIGAVRLPNNTFKSHAGTSVVSDLLIFKKREPGTPYAGEPFIETEETKMPINENYSTNKDINSYFKKHPEMVLGDMILTSSRFGGYGIDVVPRAGEVLTEQIIKALSSIKVKMDYPVKSAQSTQEAIKREIIPANGTVKENAYTIENGSLYRKEKGMLVPIEVEKATLTRIKGLIGVRDAARALLKTQLENKPEAVKEAARKQLNKVYDNFVAKHDPITAQGNRRAFIDDPDYPFLLALEKNFDPKAKKAEKADLFFKDTIMPIKEITHVDSPKEALVVSLNESGQVNLDRMATLTGQTVEEVTNALISDNLIFKQTDGSFEIAERYLSGNVRVKLEQAEAMAKIDPSYKPNVEALKAVQPRDLTVAEIKPQLGQVWIPNEVYNQFAAHLFGRRVNDFDIQYMKQTGNFTLKYTGYQNLKVTPEALTKWGTSKKDGWTILNAALNNKDVKCTTKDEEGRTIVLAKETALAKEKLEAVKEEFKNWIFSDTTRAETLASLYNYTQNNIALPKYDGSHLVINGMNPLKQLREHQRNAVWRIISSGGNTLLAHKVGAGKTGEMAAAAMALRQMGIVKKPMFVVPNHLVEQWGEEFLSFFPGANILVAGKKDFQKDRRKLLMNKIATGDYDAVIVGESSFKSVSMSEGSIQDFYAQQLLELEEAMRLAKESGLRKNDPTVKQLETAKKKLEVKLEKKLAKVQKDKENTPFEELGIDSLFVDEAHRFKNLMYTTNMTNVSGLGSKDGSDRAFDLYMKIRHLQKLNGGKGVVFATATPVMNSMSEMYIMQKYLQSDLLEQRGLLNFDAWAKQFGEVVTVMEMTPEGKGYRQKQSFSKFKNVGELIQLFRSFADVLTQIEGLKIPNMKDNKPITVVCEPSQFQLDYINNLAERAEAIRGRKVDPTEDNMLKVTSDGRKLALDQRLIDPTALDDPGSKVNRSIENVVEIYKRTKANKSAQLIFCDLSTPKPKDNKKEDEDEEDEESNENVSLYEEIKNKLILKGIKANEIAFIHEAKTDVQKIKLFTQVNKGEVRILLGSTEKMGVGMNAQKKLIALHHLDAPWRPGDVEQRDGRILRQGNENPEVEIYHYVTEKTFDARMWDNLYRKAAFINTAMNATIDMRDMEDVGEFALSAAEIKAIASGNPIILEQFEVEANLRKLYMSQQAFDNELIEAKTRLARLRTRNKVLEEGIIKLTADLKQRIDVSGENFTMVINKKTYLKREEAGQALIELYRKNTPKEDKNIGSFAGFELYLTPTAEVYVRGEGVYSTKLNAESASGTIQSLESRVKSMDRLLEGHKEELQEVKRNIPELEKASNAVFPKEAELKQLAKRFDEICKELGITDESSDTVEGEINEEDQEAGGTSAFTSVNGGPQLGAATGRNTDVQGTKRASEIYKEFAKAYDVAIKSRPRKGTLGTYNPKTHLVRIKKANDIPVLCHEVGHLIDKYYQFSQNPKASYAKELERLGVPTSRKSYSKIKVRQEGVAEFLRLYWTDTEEAKKSSFYKPFIKAIRTEELEVIENLREEIWKLTNLAPEERIGKTIKFYDEKTKKETTPFETFFRKVYTGLVDENYTVEWAAGQLGGQKSQEAMKHMLSKMRGYEGIAMFDIDAGKQGSYQVDLKGNPMGPSYQSIVGELHKDKNLREDFLKYQVAKRGLDYFKRELEFPETKEVCEETIRILEIKHPEFKQTFKQLLQYRKNSLKLLVQSGLMSQEAYEKILEDNPNYTPLKRDVDNYRYGVGDSRKLGASKHVIHKLKGGGQDIIDPEVNDINNTFVYRSAAMRNATLVKLADLADSSEDMGWLMSKANINMKVFELSQEQINKIVQEALGKLGIMTDDMDFDVMNKIFKPNYAAGPNQVVIYREGKAQIYDVAPELYQTLASLNTNQSNVLIDTLATIGRVAKTGIIFTPQYIYRNLARDTFQNLIGTKAGINPLDVVGGFISAVRKDKWYQLAQKQGGTTNYFTASDREYAKETIKEIMVNQKMAIRLLHKIKHPLNTIQDMIEPTEMAGRIAEMKKTLKKHGNSEAAINAAIYNARDLSVDFKKAGAWIKKLQLNRMINFFNAQIQGEVKDVNLLFNKKTSLKTLLRSLIYLTAPTLMLWWINKDNENYQDLPSYRKDFFFNIPIGDPSNTQLFFLVPRPFGLGTLFAALPERLMEKAYRDNPRSFYGFGETLEQAWGVSLMPSALTPVYELQTNRDWRDIPILNQGDEQLKPYLQYNQYTSETSKKLASITKDIPGMPEMLQSPKQLDHLIKGYTGTLGSMALNTVDFMTGKKDRNPLSTIGSSFVVDASKRPETIELFYEYKRKLDLDYVAFKVTQEMPKDYKPYVRELFTRISSELTNIKERLEKVEALPESKEKEQLLQKLRDEEIALMKGATRIYEEEYYR